MPTHITEVQMYQPTLQNHDITENIVAKNTPMKLTMPQKKSVIVLKRQIDRFDFTSPEKICIKFTFNSIHRIANQENMAKVSHKNILEYISMRNISSLIKKHN